MDRAQSHAPKTIIDPEAPGFSPAEKTVKISGALAPEANELFRRHSRIHRHPIHFPSVPAIRRKTLLEPIRIRCDIQKNISHQNHAPAKIFPVVKFSALAAKFSDGRR